MDAVLDLSSRTCKGQRWKEHHDIPWGACYGDLLASNSNDRQANSVVFFVGILFGVMLGIIGAIRRNSAIGQAAVALAFVGYAFPDFVIAIGLILIFSYNLGWFPSMGDATPAHLVMPVFTLSIRSMAEICRFTRSSMLDVMSQDYIRTA